MPRAMKRILLLSSLLLAAACHTVPVAPDEPKPKPEPEVVDVPGKVVDPFAAGAVAVQDPALEARKAFQNPGGMWMPRQMGLPPHAAVLAGMGVKVPAADLGNPLLWILPRSRSAARPAAEARMISRSSRRSRSRRTRPR